MQLFRKFSWLYVLGGLLALPIILPVLLVLFIIIVRGFYEMQGYYSFTFNSGEIAEIAIKKHDPTICQKIRVFDIGTTSYEQITNCIFIVAKKMQDPSVCELLMPSEYGIACIGSAESHGLPSLGCHVDSYKQPYQITCIEDTFTGKTRTYTAQNIENCSLFEKENNKYALHWCYAKRAEQFGEIDACIKHADSEDFRNDCYYKRASYVKDLNLDFCKKIENSILRSGCTETVKAWIQYPELRPTL